MRLTSTSLILLCLLAACASPQGTPASPTPLTPTSTAASVVAPDPLTGDWLGAARKPGGGTASIQITFDGSENRLRIEPMAQIWEIAVTQKEETVQFTASSGRREPFQKIEFSGTLVNGVFSGVLNWDGTASPIHFIPITAVDQATLSKYEGLFRFESGRVLSILVSPEYASGGLQFFSQSLMMTDFETGALRGLYPIEDYTFAVGALRVVGAPFVGQIQFITDEQGNATGLMWWDGVNEITPSQFAARVPYNAEEITFTSADGTTLAGRISLPETNLPLPAFMMLHGSEQGMRDNFGNKVMAHYMLSRGFAILNYDKRGVGESGGVYQESASLSNLNKHAEDAVAGVEYLVSRPEIDVKRIGLIGFSQAGWIIPLAASKSPIVTHMVILSGPVASTAQEDRFSTYTDDGDSARDYDDARITGQLREMSPGGFDPLPVIAELTQTGLWLWGSVDKSVPVTFSAENLQSLIDSGKNKLSYQILPNGDHNLNSSPHGFFAEIPYSPGVLLYTPLGEWLQTNMLPAKE
jgi:pimeloyl-ACP methyl ester carboxylesterase